MKKFVVTFEHHKYFNGGMAVYTRTEEIKARTEKSATNKFFKLRKSNAHSIYCLVSVAEVV